MIDAHNQANMKEIWKDIAGYEGRYKVSNLGRVMSLACKRAKLLSPSNSKKNYKIVCLRNDGKSKVHRVHRLVAKEFLPAQSTSQNCVNHKDFDRSNNRLSNLEWVSTKENAVHSRKHGRMLQLVKMSEFQIKRARLMKEVAHLLSQNKMSRLFNCSQSNISRILNNKIWAHAA